MVCFGDFAMADLLQPGVTVVDHSAEAVGAAAAARLAERIAHPDLPAVDHPRPGATDPPRLRRGATVTAHEPREAVVGIDLGHHDVEGVVAHAIW